MLQSTAADISAEATTTENHNYLRRIQTATNNTPIITTEENQSVTLDILHINDHHSHLDDKTMTIPQRILPTVQNRQVRFGGFPRLINLFRQYSNSTSHPEATNILKLHAGDALSGTGFYRWFGHQPDVDLMHEICFDAVTLGNHEFNDGDGPLAEFLTKLTDINSPCQNTRVLISNLAPGPDSPLLQLQEHGFIAPFMIRRFGEDNQHQVGIIGVDIRNKTLTGSSPSPGTTLLDERESVQFQVKLLTGMGINKIIVLSHLGYARDKRWLADIEGIDVIVGGHTHTLLGRMETDEDLDDGDLDIADTDGTYPTVETSKTTGKPVCIVQAWKFAHGMGHLKVEWDGNGDVTACGGSFLFPFETHPDASEQDAAAVKNYLSSLTSPSFLEINEWLPAKERLQAYRDAMGNNGLDTVILSASDTICGPSKSSSCPLQSNAGQGGAACNLVAQSMLSGAADADVAIQNAGGCRADITAGNFTMENAAELLPYSDTLVTLNLTGSRIKNVLEQALHMTFKEDSSGSYPHAAGLRFDVDATKPMGERISNLQVNSRLGEGAWNDIDLVAIYTVVTNSFLAPAGRDGYEEFRNVSLVNDTQMSYMDSFVEYAEDISPLTNPDNETLSTQSYVGPSDSNESESELEGSSNDADFTLREIPRVEPEAQGVEDSGPNIAISEGAGSGPAIAVLEDADNDRRISSRAETLSPCNIVLAICQFGFLFIVSNTATFL